VERTITIPRWATVLLLLLTTAAIIVVTMVLSGKSYSRLDPVPFEDLRHLAHRLEHRPISTHLMAVILVPTIANTLLFVPWGFLMFLSIYSVDRPTLQTYVLTILIGMSLSAIIEGYQYFLPTRVADVNDVIWNTMGAAIGAVLGHLRSRVRFEFD
jgi:glycopeptide antibiotics resistance protein